MKYYIGIDNGVTGSVTVLSDEREIKLHIPIPTKRELGYQKSKAKFITRVDVPTLIARLEPFRQGGIAFLERPMINPMRFSSSVSAARALEATLIALEVLGIGYSYVDSKEWQKNLLPKGLKKHQLKNAADNVVARYFPNLQLVFKGAGDSVLIALNGYNKSGAA